MLESDRYTRCVGFRRETAFVSSDRSAQGCRFLTAGLELSSSESATRQIRKTGCLRSSKSSSSHCVFWPSLRQIPPIMSAQERVNSCQAAFRSAKSQPCCEGGE